MKKNIKEKIENAEKNRCQLEFLDTFYDKFPCDSCNVALDPENRKKNHYPHLALPFDHNLIKSTGEYVNASPMKFNGIDYIATQGPREQTMSAFWKMIFSEDVGLIVSVTNLWELYGRTKVTKFHQFWPDFAQTMEIGTLHITLLDEKVLNEWSNYGNERLVLRLYEIKSGSIKKQVNHLHMENWPDDGVIHPESFLYLHQKVDDLHGSKPIVVHCAAGIGRTGTFIATHSLLNAIKDEPNEFDVIKRVQQIREYRYGAMVAQPEQYGLILDTLKLSLDRLP